MPAVDACEPQVINALQKVGWSVSDKPYIVRDRQLYIVADFSAVRGENGALRRIVVVEVKCFADRHAYHDDLYRSISQYVIYRTVLTDKRVEAQLYLAVPDFAYEELFRKRIISEALQELQMKLIVINLDGEEIVAWLD